MSPNNFDSLNAIDDESISNISPGNDHNDQSYDYESR